MCIGAIEPFFTRAMSTTSDNAALRRLRNLTDEERALLIEPAETLYVPIGDGCQARVSIEVIEEGLPSPNERQIRRRPTVRELHTTADALLRRVYQFTPVD